MNGLKLHSLDPICHRSAIEAFNCGDGKTFANCGYQTGACLLVIYDNKDLLLQKGIYEEALAEGFIAGKQNNGNLTLKELEELFECADSKKLRRCGDELPEGESLTIYRGVSGPRNRRRIHGLSWTTSLPVACWFASCSQDPHVYQAMCGVGEIYFATNDRNESEIVAKPKRSTVSRLSLTDEAIEMHASQYLKLRDKLHQERLENLLQDR